MPYKAVYKNKSGQILEIEIITENGKSWLVTEGGQSAPFGLTLNDAALGEMTYVETKKTEEPMPVPEDPNRERAISILRRRLQTDFKSNEAFQNFLNGEAGLRRAIDNDFDRVSIVKIQEWGARITKATTEQGSRLDELRRHFMGTYLGDLFIEQLAEHGAKRMAGMHSGPRVAISVERFEEISRPLQSWECSAAGKSLQAGIRVGKGNKNMDSVERLLKERKTETGKQPSETLAAKISLFLDGGMSAVEMDMLSKTHAAAIDAEIRRRAEEKAHHADAKQREVEEYATKIWKGKQSAESFFGEQEQFMADYPQLVRSRENIDVIAHRLIAKNLVPSYDNLVFVLHELAKDGAVSLSPSAIRAGEEDQISGETLKRHANLKQLCDQRKKSNASASQIRVPKNTQRARRDWPVPSIPPLVMAGIEKNLDAFASLHPDYYAAPKMQPR